MKNWSVTATCGGRYPAIDPVFFNDRSRIAVATALAIKVYQLSTKQMIAKINFDCTDASQLVVTKSEQEFLVVKKSGTLEKIGIHDSLAKRVDVEGHIKVRKLVFETTPTKFIALVSNSKGLYEVGELDISEQGSFISFYESKVAHIESGMATVSSNAAFAAFVHPKSGKIELVNLKTREAVQLNSANKSTATSLAVSDAGLVALGNASGVIDVAYPSTGELRALKWHLEPVRTLKFSQNDEYLLSGGSERVLVFWQLATNRQQFLPRLDGTITSISANRGNTLYGLTLNDSQLVVISAVDLVSRLHVAGTKAQFNKVVPDHQVARRRRRKRADLDMWANADYTTALTVHPGTRNAYLLSGASQAQIFSLIRDDQEASLSLARTLDTGKVRGELEIQDPRVSLLRFTSNGNYMITVDTQQTPKGLLSSNDCETNLKFWHLVDNKWTIITRVSGPHGNMSNSTSTAAGATNAGGDLAGGYGDIEIRDLVASDDTVVTAGSDGSLRMWKLNAGDHTWSLRHIMPAFAAHTRYVSVAWSLDKSVLALAHDAMIYLVDPQQFKIVKQIPNIAGSSVRSLLFVRSYIVALARSRLVVYDLVSMAQRWAIALKTPSNGQRLVAADPVLGKFALAVNYWTPQYRVNSRLVLFDPSKSPVPEESYTHPFAVGGLVLIPGTSSYCFIDQRGVLSTLAGAAAAQQPEPEKLGLTTTLVSLYQSRQSEAENSADVQEELATKSLDVNAMSKVFDANTDLDQLFDRVMSLVS